MKKETEPERKYRQDTVTVSDESMHVTGLWGGGGRSSPKNWKVLENICARATTRIAVSCAVISVMIQLGHFLKKREYIHMPRFSEYLKLSEKWRCWFPFFTSAIIA